MIEFILALLGIVPLLSIVNVISFGNIPTVYIADIYILLVLVYFIYKFLFTDISKHNISNSK